MDTFVWTGFTIGILGSFHCLGMCGPLVMAVPHISDSKGAIALDGILYNFGRTISYTLMGLVLGLLGVSVRLAGFQDYLSIGLGIIMLLLLFIPKKYYAFVNDTKGINKVIVRIKMQFRNLLERKSRLTLLFIGMLNGFLPCGLVYIALAGSLASADILNSSLFMFAFGIGTIPMLAVVYFSKNLITPNFRIKINKAIPYAIGIVAVLLILRGLNLGIPFISPILPDTVISEGGSCCH